MDGEHEKALDALDDALTSVRRLLLRPGFQRRFMAALGEPLELGTFRAVRAVGRLTETAEETPGVGSVADLLGVDGSTASRLVDRAVEAGYVRRQPAAADRRRTELALTDAGHDLVMRANVARRRVLGEITGDWNIADLQELTRLLERLRADMDEVERP